MYQFEEGRTQGLRRAGSGLSCDKACLQGGSGNYRLLPQISLQLSRGRITEVAGAGRDYLTSQRNSRHWLHWSKMSAGPSKYLAYYVIFGFIVSEVCLIDVNRAYMTPCPCSVPPYPKAAGKQS